MARPIKRSRKTKFLRLVHLCEECLLVARCFKALPGRYAHQAHCAQRFVDKLRRRHRLGTW